METLSHQHDLNIVETLNHKHDLDIKVIDRDHREISDLLVEINFNVARDGDAGRRISSLRDTARATRSHFLLEEGMMEATKFPGLALPNAAPMDAAADRAAGRLLGQGEKRAHARADRAIVGVAHRAYGERRPGIRPLAGQTMQRERAGSGFLFDEQMSGRAKARTSLAQPFRGLYDSNDNCAEIHAGAAAFGSEASS